MEQRYLKISELKKYLSVSERFIRKKMTVSLFENEHYFYIDSSKVLRFHKDAIDRWVRSTSKKRKIENVWSKLND